MKSSLLYLSILIQTATAAVAAIAPNITSQGSGSSKYSNPCSTKEFEYNLENWNGSGAAKYYLNWSIATRKKKGKSMKRKGEIARFAKEHWGDDSFFCTFEEPPCSREPHCEEIWATLSKDKEPTKEVVKKTRQAYFAAMAIVQINRYHCMKIKLIHHITRFLIPQFARTNNRDWLTFREPETSATIVIESVMRRLYSTYTDILTRAAGLSLGSISTIAKLETAITKAVTAAMDASMFQRTLEPKLWTLPTIAIVQGYDSAMSNDRKRFKQDPATEFAYFLTSNFAFNENGLYYMGVALNDGKFNHGSTKNLTSLGTWMKSTFWPIVTEQDRAKVPEWTKELTNSWNRSLTSDIESWCSIKCSAATGIHKECDWSCPNYPGYKRKKEKYDRKNGWTIPGLIEPGEGV